ncbi:uncharacterized protein LOC134531219 [Bacillus rossius redtenbacheri]|uniref:uncharacterized protein LOC134531219 n=1 Tax=Bacillus rossius redtenbacheri TaxID=93214 RepID=UPI002FDDB9F8
MKKMPPKRDTHYSQAFRDTYTRDFPCILKSSKGTQFAFCSVCRCDINIGHGGRYDINLHVNCSKHLANVKSVAVSSKVSDYFAKNNSTDNAVIRAECMFTNFLVEHNIPLNVSDHAGPLFRKMFPNSEEAKKFGCARTKSTAIVKEMATDATDKIVSNLQTVAFSVATDGSNDSESKLYPLVVTFFDANLKMIVSRLLSLPVLQGDSTGRNIGGLVISELRRLNIPLENLIAFSADNAPAMLGHKNGVAAVLKECLAELVVVGCPCHLINLAAEKAAATLPCQIEDVLVDIYYFLEKSVKRKEKLQKFQVLHGKEARKILKHICTRWLSLGKSLVRLLEQWEPLLSFFNDEVSVQKQQSSLMTYKIPGCDSGKSTISTQIVPVKSKCATSSDSSESGKSVSGTQLFLKKREVKQASFGSSQAAAKKQKLDGTVQKKCTNFNNSVSSAKSTLKNKCSTLSREEKLFMFLSTPSNKAFCLFLVNVTPTFDKVNVLLQSASPQIHNFFFFFRKYRPTTYLPYIFF